MKRVRVAPGKFVTISAETSEKVTGIFETGLTRDQVRDLIASEPSSAAGLMAGSAKPLMLAKSGKTGAAQQGPQASPGQESASLQKALMSSASRLSVMKDS